MDKYKKGTEMPPGKSKCVRRTRLKNSLYCALQSESQEKFFSLSLSVTALFITWSTALNLSLDEPKRLN